MLRLLLTELLSGLSLFFLWATSRYGSRRGLHRLHQRVVCGPLGRPGPLMALPFWTDLCGSIERLRRFK
jgi:hypothetical protein